MTTEPGVSGSVFQRKNFLRIRKSHQLFPALKIHVDGGVNDQIAFILRMLGVYAAVSGSYLVNHLPISAALIPLRFGHTSSTILVKEIAIAKEDLPILPLENTSLKQIISKLDEYKMGFVFFEKDEKLAGICSNADLRKGLLKCAKQQQYIDFDMSNILDFVNIKPFVMYENASIKEMLEQIKAQAFPILFLPVVNDNQLLTGALTFNELIKGEE